MRPIDTLIIHCTATRPDWYAGQDVGQKATEIRRWHMSDRGWSDIGYHYLIDRDSSVAAGRPVERVGAHVKGHNKGSIGIALIGGHGGGQNDQFADHFTPAQDMALRRLITDLQSKHKITRIAGHNEFAAKACPCFNTPRWLNRRAEQPRSMAKSRTLQGAATAAASSVGSVSYALNQLNPTAQYIVLGFTCVALIAIGFIARERIRKWAAGDQ